MAESRVTVSDLKEQLTPSIERTARVTSRSVTSKLSAELRASGILEDGYRGTRGFEERLSQIVEEAVMVAVEIVLCEFETVVDRSLKELQTTVAEYHKEIERLRQKTEAHRGPKKSMRGHTSCGDSRPGAMGTAGGSIGQDSSSKKELNPKESAVVEKGRCLVVALPRLETLISRQEESSGSPGEIHSEKLKADVSKCHLKMEDCVSIHVPFLTDVYGSEQNFFQQTSCQNNSSYTVHRDSDKLEQTFVSETSKPTTKDVIQIKMNLSEEAPVSVTEELLDQSCVDGDLSQTCNGDINLEDHCGNIRGSKKMQSKKLKNNEKQRKKANPHTFEYTKSKCKSTKSEVSQKMNTRIKHYSCKDCGKSFKQLDHLKIHQTIHITEKPYNCRDCGKRYTRSDSLNRQQKIHTRAKEYCYTQ
ncbi:zinc finger protein with KRAB and SCAN domains 4-like isoform X1 [Erpetoichthys calabaricus]|uniref:zinc finger protein with KRAB and SCAN domains 4-like isoform X1 n=1 Tax=Erpetoichthys calabaricus TaxID=27687 RepID=UPI00109F9194|nr:zinc finger protein with KRAB and SCAN domains 4-like isoform X1 [Erpetoichthys calabaricus]